MPTTKLKEFLEANGVAHAVIPHPIAFTATSVAGAAHIPGKAMAIHTQDGAINAPFA